MLTMDQEGVVRACCCKMCNAMIKRNLAGLELCGLNEAHGLLVLSSQKLDHNAPDSG